MKPKHNRVMCPDCFRQKMLFETQKQADNFIKWNGDDIDTNGGELRSYYCKCCGGWHITSKPHRAAVAATENAAKAEKKQEENRESIVQETYKKIIEEIPTLPSPKAGFIRCMIKCYIKVNNIELTRAERDNLNKITISYYFKQKEQNA